MWNQNETPSIVLCRDCFASFPFLGLCVCPERIWDWGLQEWRRPTLDDPWYAAVLYLFSFPRRPQLFPRATDLQTEPQEGVASKRILHPPPQLFKNDVTAFGISHLLFNFHIILLSGFFFFSLL